LDMNSFMQISTYVKVFQPVNGDYSTAWTLSLLIFLFLLSPTSSSHSLSIKFKELPEFKGKPEEVDGFLYVIQDGIIIQCDAFISDK